MRIPSFEDLGAAVEGAPYGPGPRKALDAALAMARDMGFEVHDDAGHVGYADFAGASEEQLGIIGHIDVVPAGPGWHFEPYQVTRKDGYLLGRGVIDDKGPSVVALHAMNLWRCMQFDGQAPQLPCTLRFIFGVNEETRMDDVHYYRAHHADPAFLFTPDAEFPVCYGEKGIYHSLMTSADVPVEQRTVISLEGGTAVNAVPGHAQAVVRAGACELPTAQGIEVEVLDGRDAAAVLEAAGAQADAAGCRLARITATGRSAHASLPQGGVSAIGLLIGYLLENGLIGEGERAYFQTVARIAAATDGTTVDLACSDADFGELTIVAGRAAMQDGRFTQTIDVRYPTAITGDERGAREAGGAGAGSGRHVREDARRRAVFARSAGTGHPGVAGLVQPGNGRGCRAVHHGRRHVCTRVLLRGKLRPREAVGAGARVGGRHARARRRRGRAAAERGLPHLHSHHRQASAKPTCRASLVCHVRAKTTVYR